MIPDPGNRRMLVADGATGHVMGAGLDGDIVLFSEVQGHEVLTGIARGPDGLVYVASFSQLPHAKGDGAILRLSPDGSSAVVVDNLTTPIDLAFDTSGRLYVLEFIDDTGSSDPYRDRVGRLLRHDPRGDGWASGVVLSRTCPSPPLCSSTVTTESTSRSMVRSADRIQDSCCDSTNWQRAPWPISRLNSWMAPDTVPLSHDIEES